MRRSPLWYVAFVCLIALLATISACAGMVATELGDGPLAALPVENAERQSNQDVVAVSDGQSLDPLLHQDRPVVLALLDSGNT